MRTFAFTVAVAIALPAIAQTNPAAPAASAKPTPPPPAKPNERLTNEFKGAVGTWNCKSEWSMPGQPKRQGTSTMTIAPQANGFAYSLEYNSTKKGTPPFKSMVMFNAEGDMLTETWADSQGDMVRGFSEGEVDGKTVWTEEGTNGKPVKSRRKPVKSRTIVTRKGNSEITIVGEIPDPSGNWVRISQQTCTKKG